MGDDSEFWRDDAAAIAQRQTGNVLRMPAASAVIPAELVGSYALPSADHRTSGGKQYSTTATVVCMGVILAVFAGIVYMMRPDAVTLAEFQSLEDGMTLQQCNALIGQSGTVEATASGMQQASEVITWNNSNGSHCVVTFLNGRKLFGAQSGLK